MATTEKSNERRRRIMERGSDRLALITGQLKNLERTSSLPSAAPPSLSFNDRSEIHLDAPAPEVIPRKESTISQQVPKSLDSSYHTRSVTSPDIMKPQAPAKNGPPPTHKPPSSSSSSSSSSLPSSKAKRSTFLSSRRLNSCIIATEITRAKCSFVIAVIVLLFHFTGSFIGMNNIQESWQKYKPVFLIVVTNVTVVLVQMLQGKGVVVEENTKEDKATDNVEDKNWRDAFMVLERGLTAYQGIRAMFIDCSIYMIVVICGLSFA